MDFANRNAPQRASAPAPAPQPQSGAKRGAHDKKSSRFSSLRGAVWLKAGALVLLFGGTVLVVAILLGLNFGASANEGKFINRKQMQAVFVNVNGTNGGQVYFGNIREMTDEYINLTNVYYIQNQTGAQNTQQVESQAYNLVKLGCELHGPEDQMFINRSQVFFWENLKNDSQVSQKAAEFAKNNPNGQKCNQQPQQQQPQGTTQGTGTTTPAPQAPATKGTSTTTSGQ